MTQGSVGFRVFGLLQLGLRLRSGILLALILGASIAFVDVELASAGSSPNSLTTSGSTSQSGLLSSASPLDKQVNGTSSTATQLAELPAAAQAAILGKIGSDLPGYGATKSGKSFRLANSNNSLSADLRQRGLLVQTKNGTLGMTLAGIGVGNSVRKVRNVAPSASGNRVEYQHQDVTEWYVNSPAGVEQGFTLAKRPGTATGSLNLDLAVTGNLTPHLSKGAKSLSFANASGHTVLNYGGLAVSDAKDRSVPASFAVSKGRVQIRVDDSKAQYPLTVDPLFQDTQLTTSDRQNTLGFSIAADGDTVVVGAPSAADGSTTPGGIFGGTTPNYYGAVYVFTRPAAGWTAATGIETAKLTARETGFRFPSNVGHSVAISGDIIVAGAPTRPGARNAPSAYLWVKPAGGWLNAPAQTATLVDGAGSGQVVESFGTAVATSGDTVSVGSPDEQVGPNKKQGAVSVFERPAGGWNGFTLPDAKLTASDGSKNGGLGTSIAMADNTIVAGAPGNNAAYVFEKPAGRWRDHTQNARLSVAHHAHGAITLSGFGYVAISGDVVAVGAPRSRVTIGGIAHDYQGAVYAFKKPAAGGWIDATEYAAFVNGAGDENQNLGQSVAVAGNKIYAGQPGDIFNRGGPGSVLEFTLPAHPVVNGVPLHQTDVFQPANAANDDWFGFSIAVSGSTVLGGAPHGDSNRGAAYVFGADVTAPAITVTSPSNGEAFAPGQHVVAAYACQDNQSGVANCHGSVPNGHALDTSVPGDHSFTVNAVDNAGNASVVTHRYRVVAPNKVPPAISISSPTDHGVFKLGQKVTASFACVDTHSGVASCSGTVPNGALLNTSTVGTHVFTVHAVDGLGNASTVTHHYRVIAVPVPPVPKQKHVSGQAKLSFISGKKHVQAIGCPRKAFTVEVAGRQITRVTFLVRGKKLKVVNVKPNPKSQKVKISINPARLKLPKGTSVITAKVEFAPSAKTKTKAPTLKFRWKC